MSDKLHCPTCKVHIDEHPASRCLDAWMADGVMGLPVEFHTDNPNNEKYFYLDIVGSDGICKDVEKYSTSIAAAWKVVDKMTGEPESLYVMECRMYKCRKAAIRFLLIPPRDWVLNFVWDDTTASHGLAPLAICRAAIKATAQAD